MEFKDLIKFIIKSNKGVKVMAYRYGIDSAINPLSLRDARIGILEYMEVMKHHMLREILEKFPLQGRGTIRYLWSYGIPPGFIVQLDDSRFMSELPTCDTMMRCGVVIRLELLIED